MVTFFKKIPILALIVILVLGIGSAFAIGTITLAGNVIVNGGLDVVGDITGSTINDFESRISNLEQLIGCDKDNDGFMDTKFNCGGNDCDDNDDTVFPGASEIKDGKDNDCDSDGKADEGLIIVGDIIISEILYDSSSTPDESHEWFEIFNPTNQPINLRTWKIKDNPGGAQQITQIQNDLIVSPSEFAVLCSDSFSSSNNGMTCDYEYGYLTLTNTADEIILDFDSLIIDEVKYDENTWPTATSGSLNLDPDSVLLDNNDPLNWCNSPEGPPELSNGDDASPGMSNVNCP